MGWRAYVENAKGRRGWLYAWLAIIGVAVVLLVYAVIGWVMWPPGGFESAEGVVIAVTFSQTGIVRFEDDDHRVFEYLAFVDAGEGDTVVVVYDPKDPGATAETSRDRVNASVGLVFLASFVSIGSLLFLFRWRTGRWPDWTLGGS